MSTPVTPQPQVTSETDVAPPFPPSSFPNGTSRPSTDTSIHRKVAVLWAISVLALTILYAAFTLRGYALLSIATIPHGQSLSIFYATLIGSGILLTPICILSLLTMKKSRHFGKHFLYSQFGMKHLPSVFLVPVILGGSALGLKILQVSGATVRLGEVVDRGHLVRLACWEVMYIG